VGWYNLASAQQGAISWQAGKSHSLGQQHCPQGLLHAGIVLLGFFTNAHLL
jgi:hypothetical protein